MDGPRSLLRPPRNRWPPYRWRGNAEDCRLGSDNPKSPKDQSKNREASSPSSRRPARMTQAADSGEAFGSSFTKSKHQPRIPTHYEPSGSVPGPHHLDSQGWQGFGRLGGGDSGRASGGRFWHGFAVRRPLVWKPGRMCPRSIPGDFLTRRAIQISLLLDRGCRGNWPATLTAISSSCSPRRTWHASAASRAAPSTGRLREASCGRRGSATGSGSNPPSWNAGSGSRLSRPTYRPGLGGRDLPGMFRAVACGLCSTRRATDRRMR